MPSRRRLLQATAGAGLAAFAVASTNTMGRIATGLTSAGRRPLAPEARVDPRTGAVTPNPDQIVVHATCPGCDQPCNLRLRIDRASGTVLRIAGNPYAADPALPYATPLRDSFALLSRAGRAPLCASGAALPDDPARLRDPLKRVGPRGAGRWQRIDAAQLVHEVVEGGDLFGEGEVAGLRALRRFEPIDKARPELGPIANQVALLHAGQHGRLGIARRFLLQAYGSTNLIGPPPAATGWPNLDTATMVLVFGEGAGPGGVPVQRLARQLGARRAAGGARLVAIEPVLGQAGLLATGGNASWLPIRPGGGAALAQALIAILTDADATPALAAQCGVPAADIAALARDLAAHAPHAAAVLAGGAASPDAAATDAALRRLNARLGNPGPPWPALDAPAIAEGNGPRYDLAGFPGMRSPSGQLCAPKAVIQWQGDPRRAPAPALPAGAGLCIAVTSRLAGDALQADYVVPDGATFENWGWEGQAANWPVAAPPVAGPDGMEDFLIACAKAMELPGFGAGALRDSAGRPHPLDRAADWYLRGAANLAFANQPVPDAVDEEVFLAGLDRLRPLLETVLAPSEWRKAATVLARGGRFDTPEPLSVEPAEMPPTAPATPETDAAWPLLLVTGNTKLPARYRAGLAGPTGPVIALHPEDAGKLGLRGGEAVTVETTQGRIAGTLLLRRGIMRGVVAVTPGAEITLPQPARLIRA